MYCAFVWQPGIFPNVRLVQTSPPWDSGLSPSEGGCPGSPPTCCLVEQAQGFSGWAARGLKQMALLQGSITLPSEMTHGPSVRPLIPGKTLMFVWLWFKCRGCSRKTGSSMLILMSIAHQQQEQACRQHGFKGLKYRVVRSKILSQSFTHI